MKLLNLGRDLWLPIQRNTFNLLRKHALLLTVLLWILVVSTRFYLNGFVYGLDYSLYHPDGAHYAYRTLTFLSSSDYKSALEVSNWYAVNGIRHNLIIPSELLPANNPVWHLVAPRILYPILSVPFVFMFGLSGMLVIPTLSLLGMMVVIHSIGRFYGRVEIGLLFNLLLLTSVTVNRWFVANITDGLLAFIVSLFILVELRVSSQKRWALYTFTLIMLASITRFSAPIFILVGLGFLVLKNYKKASVILLSTTLSAVPLLFFSIQSAFLPAAGNQTLIGKFLQFPVQSVKVFFIEVAQLMVLDRQFLILILFSIFCAISGSRTTQILTINVLLGVFLIGFVNGTLGVNFRYQLPVIPFLAWSFIEYLSVSRKPTKTSLHVIGEESK